LPVLSEWLQLMLGEIARKREELECGRAEDERRERENATEHRDAPQPRADQPMAPGQEPPQHEEAARAEQSSAARAAQR
jgi:hypothetical protein